MNLMDMDVGPRFSGIANADIQIGDELPRIRNFIDSFEQLLDEPVPPPGKGGLSIIRGDINSFIWNIDLIYACLVCSKVKVVRFLVIEIASDIIQDHGSGWPLHPTLFEGVAHFSWPFGLLEMVGLALRSLDQAAMAEFVFVVNFILS